MNDLDLRRVPLPHVENFRTLGGYATKDNRITRHGLLYRSALPWDVPEEEMTRMYRLGIRTVIDLRSEQEEEEIHNSFLDVDWVQHHRIDVFEALKPGQQGEGEANVDFFCRLYILLADEARQKIRQVLELVAQSVKDGAVLFHCRGGKDRTGITAALLLYIAGVEERDIFADYMISGIHIPSLAETDPFGSDVRYIQAVWSWMKDHFGGPGGYLKEIGISDALIEELREAITAPLECVELSDSYAVK